MSGSDHAGVGWGGGTSLTGEAVHYDPYIGGGGQVGGGGKRKRKGKGQGGVKEGI